jgi:hypothetical protein
MDHTTADGRDRGVTIIQHHHLDGNACHFYYFSFTASCTALATDLPKVPTVGVSRPATRFGGQHANVWEGPIGISQYTYRKVH